MKIRGIFRFSFFVLFTAFAAAEDSFITQYEYGEMLYKNPRGIGCIHCHGNHGKGGYIAAFKEEGKKVVLRGPDIRHVDIDALKKALQKRYRIMPTYFLTAKEIAALHTYLAGKVE